jgi:hypothetical protein
MENRVERITLETDRHRIVGDLTLPREGYRSRVSDYLNVGELTVVARSDAESTPIGGGESERRSFVAIGRRHVRLAYPAVERQE